MIPSEMQKIEMKLDRKNRKLLEERRDIEFQLRAKLDAMRPQTRFVRQLISKSNSQVMNLVIQRGSRFSFNNGDKSSEIATQNAREADKFSY